MFLVSTIFVAVCIVLALSLVQRKKIKAFAVTTFTELKRVSWIDTKTATNLTISVVIVAGFFALAITVYELVLQEVFDKLIEFVE